MSVLERIQELSKEPGNSSIPKFQGASPEDIAEMEMMQSVPIPGQSLTQDPNNKMPYETPPEFTDVSEFMEETFLKLSSEETLPELLNMLRQNVPVEYAAEKYLTNAMQQGKITPDLLLLSIEPTIYIIIALATYGGVDPILYPEDDMEEEPQEVASAFKKKSRELLVDDKNEDQKVTIDEVQAPTSVPKSLLARAKKAAEKV